VQKHTVVAALRWLSFYMQHKRWSTAALQSVYIDMTSQRKHLFENILLPLSRLLVTVSHTQVSEGMIEQTKMKTMQEQLCRSQPFSLLSVLFSEDTLFAK